jgi:hypothetical protein
MTNPSTEGERLACEQIRERLNRMFPEMTFQILPKTGTRGFRIYGQRTKNMRYDRGNYFASFDVSGEAYTAADTTNSTEALLQSAVADLDGQLRLRNQ